MLWSTDCAPLRLALSLSSYEVHLMHSIKLANASVSLSMYNRYINGVLSIKNMHFQKTLTLLEIKNQGNYREPLPLSLIISHTRTFKRSAIGLISRGKILSPFHFLTSLFFRKHLVLHMLCWRLIKLPSLHRQKWIIYHKIVDKEIS